MTPADRLSPRQRACLQLVWERQATSKEIAVELGISKGTVDGYIAEAVELIGARDRRDAASVIFGARAPAVSGVHPAGVAGPPETAPTPQPSKQALLVSRPWRTREQPRNTLTFAQTVIWVAAIAVGSLIALSLAASVGDGLPRVAMPAIHAVQRLTH